MPPYAGTHLFKQFVAASHEDMATQTCWHCSRGCTPCQASRGLMHPSVRRWSPNAESRRSNTASTVVNLRRRGSAAGWPFGCASAGDGELSSSSLTHNDHIVFSAYAVPPYRALRGKHGWARVDHRMHRQAIQEHLRVCVIHRMAPHILLHQVAVPPPADDEGEHPRA